MTTSSAQTAVSAAQPKVLAYASGDMQWIGWVGPAPLGRGGAAVATRLYARKIGPGEDWRQLATVPGRAAMLASCSSQLAVLTTDGQWWAVWTDTATGEPLPANGRMRALAGDGDSLWAVGIVEGGRAAVTKPATTPATTAITITTRRTPRPVLFRQVDGRWSAVTEFPADVPGSADLDVSLLVRGDTPVVAVRETDGAVRGIRFRGGKWEPAGWSGVSAQAGAPFELLNTDGGVVLWRSGQVDRGDLFMSLGPVATPTAVQWDGHTKPDGGPPAMAFAGGRLRAYTSDGARVFEQPIGADGKPVGTATAIEFPIDPADSSVPAWIEAAFLASMTFSIGAVAARQYGQSRRPVVVPPSPANISARLAAGMIDLLPLIVPLMMFCSAMGEHAMPKNLGRWGLFVGGGFALYLLHTTALETWTGKSVGKRMFGLKVVDTGGGPASKKQLAARNLLRIIDPLVLAIVSPLGQRTGDVAAGTMVVSDRSSDRRE